MLNRFTLTNGVKTTHVQKYGTHYTSRIYRVYKTTDQIMLKGGISGGFKASSLTLFNLPLNLKIEFHRL